MLLLYFDLVPLLKLIVQPPPPPHTSISPHTCTKSQVDLMWQTVAATHLVEQDLSQLGTAEASAEQLCVAFSARGCLCACV